MVSKAIRFFATAADLRAAIEGLQQPLRYWKFGQFADSGAEWLSRAAEIPALGQASADSSVGCDAFLVTLEKTRIVPRRIERDDGSTVYAFDQLINPDSVVFTPAGSRGSDVVAGSIETVSQTAIGRKLMREFESVVRKQFTKVKAFYVGPEALRLLEDGRRLTVSLQSPREYDLSL